MYNINININWSYKELVNNIEVIKSQVLGVIASFSYFQNKDKTIFMRWVKDTIYSFKFQEWKKDKIIEYLYDDIDIDLLKRLS